MTRPLFGKPMSEKVRPIVVVNFDKYNPPHKAVNAEVRAGGPLKWLRWEVIGHRDQDILDLPPAQRFLWWVLCDLAGQQERTVDKLRPIRMTPAQLAREADLPLEDVDAALRHLWKRGRIRYTTKAGATTTLPPPNRHPVGGHVRTDLRTDGPTDERTSRAREKTGSNEPGGTGLRPVGTAVDRVIERIREREAGTA